ncbi:putative ATP synthase delta chain precursor, mitochondrial [Mrakia frigida]|uniref:F1F0 ATP synthase subunit delta n=1 Tax=Mrakia frigida TaxID=29902 RepID=UPI003FCC0605
MFASLRPIARAALPVLKRSYAEAAPASTSNQLKLSLVLPHQTLFASSVVTQVNLPAASGMMGVLAGHVPTIESLVPGLLEITEGAGSTPKKWFVSSGFATMHPNNAITINAVEAYDINDFDSAALKTSLDAAKALLNAPSSSAEVKAEAQIEVDVLTVLEAAVKH